MSLAPAIWVLIIMSQIKAGSSYGYLVHSVPNFKTQAVCEAAAEVVKTSDGKGLVKTACVKVE